ncbi:MAG: mechanosensitive ion channel protein [Desulfobulbaceae bacterium DB1]|nr:MAG: mechanosensitive ion channel protein [Desulfobulbaceae bacterium DB1]
MEDILVQVQEVITFYGLNILAALIIYIIGRLTAKFLQGFAEKLMTKGKVDPTLIHFVGNLAYIGMLTFVILAALNQLGIQTTSFIAVLGAAGLAVGLALQGSLSNFAAGVLLILFHPFKKGDFIEAAGTAGTVEEIQIFTTMLATPDNKAIIVPNSKIIGDNIVNITSKPTRRVDFVFCVGYGDDIDKVKEVIEQVLVEDERIMQDQEIFIGVAALADSSVNFAVRVWVKSSDYWPVFFDTNERMKKRFDAEGVSIPFPQRNVHVYEAARVT